MWLLHTPAPCWTWWLKKLNIAYLLTTRARRLIAGSLASQSKSLTLHMIVLGLEVFLVDCLWIVHMTWFQSGCITYSQPGYFWGCTVGFFYGYFERSNNLFHAHLSCARTHTCTRIWNTQAHVYLNNDQESCIPVSRDTLYPQTFIPPDIYFILGYTTP